MLFFIKISSTISFLESSAQLLNLIVIKIHTFSQCTSDSEFTKEAAVVRSCLTTAVTSSIKKKRTHNSNTLTTTCSNLSIELLNSFSSNSMMIFKTNFLFSVEKHLFLIISSFQNQKSKVHMLKNQIQTLLQIIFNVNMRWISDDQKIVIIIMLKNQ